LKDNSILIPSFSNTLKGITIQRIIQLIEKKLIPLKIIK